MGSSGLVAIDLQYKLLRIQKNCLFNSDGHVQMINANFAEENDVVIAFSYRGETKEVIKAVQTARKKGAYIVGVTSNTASPLYKICDACHLIPQSEGEIRLGAIQSRYAQLLICDILYIAIAQENFDAVKKMIVDTRMMLY
jgi:DNA-binding MurR/RpiR family transcriptional regulator